MKELVQVALNLVVLAISIKIIDTILTLAEKYHLFDLDPIISLCGVVFVIFVLTYPLSLLLSKINQNQR
jgi:hypothetical protein